MKIKINKLFIIFLLFIYLYNPPLFPKQTVIWSLFFVIYLLKNKIVIRRKEYKLFGELLFLVIWSFLVDLLLNNVGFDIIRFHSSEIYLLIFIPLGILAIIFIVKKYALNQKDFIQMIIMAALLQALLSIFAFLFDPVQDFFCGFLQNIMKIEDLIYWKDVRLYGLSDSLTFGTPVLQSLIGFLCILYSKKYNSKYYLFVPIIWGSGLINARITIVVVVVGLFVLLFYFIKTRQKIINQTAFFVFYIFLFFTFIFIMSDFINMSRITDPIEEIFSFLSGKVEFKTEGYLAYFFYNKNAFRLPNANNILVGGGSSNNTSDIGYIMNLWRGGILFSIYLYLFYYRLIKILIRNSKGDEDIQKYFVIFGFVLFIVNIKGDAFLSINDFLRFFFLLLILSSLTFHKSPKSLMEKRKWKY